MLSTPIENDIPDLPSPIPELVESFRKLMLDVSGDAATLSAINEIVSEEVSNKSSVCLVSDNESSDSASIKEEGISPDDPGVEDATLSAINEIFSDELEKVSNKSSVSLFSDNESSDSTSIKKKKTLLLILELKLHLKTLLG